MLQNMAEPQELTTSTEKAESGLLRLPPELRIRIYTFLADEYEKRLPRWIVRYYYPPIQEL